MNSPTFHRRRKSSQTSIPPSPTTSRPSSLIYNHSRRSSRGFTSDDSLIRTPTAGEFNPLSPGANGLDSLADELEAAWDEGDTINDDDDVADQPQDSTPQTSPVRYDTERVRDSGIDVSSPHASLVGSPRHKRMYSQQAHRRTASLTNGHEATRSEEDGLAKPLLLAMREIEKLADMHGRDIPEEPNANADPVARLIASLQALGTARSKLEAQVTRLITAHLSVSMNVAHQSRSLQSLTYHILSPLPTIYFSPEEIDELIPLLSSTTAALPPPQIDALHGLTELFDMSKDACVTISSVSDSLHMYRQTTSEAARKLRGAKDLVADIKLEFQTGEDGRTWLERGQWERRLDERSCAKECQDIIGGFERLCDHWRERLQIGQHDEYSF